MSHSGGSSSWETDSRSRSPRSSGSEAPHDTKPGRRTSRSLSPAPLPTEGGDKDLEETSMDPDPSKKRARASVIEATEELERSGKIQRGGDHTSEPDQPTMGTGDGISLDRLDARDNIDEDAPKRCGRDTDTEGARDTIHENKTHEDSEVEDGEHSDQHREEFQTSTISKGHTSSPERNSHPYVSDEPEQKTEATLRRDPDELLGHELQERGGLAVDNCEDIRDITVDDEEPRRFEEPQLNNARSSGENLVLEHLEQGELQKEGAHLGTHDVTSGIPDENESEDGEREGHRPEVEPFAVGREERKQAKVFGVEEQQSTVKCLLSETNQNENRVSGKAGPIAAVDAANEVASRDGDDVNSHEMDGRTLADLNNHTATRKSPIPDMDSQGLMAASRTLISEQQGSLSTKGAGEGRGEEHEMKTLKVDDAPTKDETEVNDNAHSEGLVMSNEVVPDPPTREEASTMQLMDTGGACAGDTGRKSPMEKMNSTIAPQTNDGVPKLHNAEVSASTGDVTLSKRAGEEAGDSPSYALKKVQEMGHLDQAPSHSTPCPVTEVRGTTGSNGSVEEDMQTPKMKQLKEIEADAAHAPTELFEFNVPQVNEGGVTEENGQGKAHGVQTAIQNSSDARGVGESESQDGGEAKPEKGVSEEEAFGTSSKIDGNGEPTKDPLIGQDLSALTVKILRTELSARGINDANLRLKRDLVIALQQHLDSL
uniref:Uncharacterized protein n=1 Tax=Compsopogon caeruleus TaxID=31354 RepID=A0A7S1TJN6_9RHOD